MKTQALLSLWLTLSLSTPALANFVATETVTMANPIEMRTTDSCTYEVNPDSVKVNWTAFKTTDRVDVTGSFKQMELSGPTRAESFAELLKGITVTINSNTVNLNDTLKEQNLISFFFEKLVGENFTGRITSVNESDRTLVLTLSLNGQIQDIPMSYTYENGKIEAKGRIDLLSFQAEEALRTLNEKCFDLHKGPDGVSKTWPDVDLLLQAEVKSDCQ